MINNYSVYEDGTVLFGTKEVLPPLCTADDPAIIPFELNRLIERDTRIGTAGTSYRKLRPFHWQSIPELPVYAADILSPKLDTLIAHNNRVLHEKLGAFCGSPIVTLDDFGIEVDEERDLVNRLAVSSGTSVPAEILPGEQRCSDGIIRRITTAEAQGYDSFKETQAVELPTGHNSAKGKRQQSTPEEMCAWLNAQQKSSFKSEVVIEGDNKVLRTADAKGTPIYAFCYIKGSNTCVLQCYDDGKGLQHPLTELNEYADEFISHYIPTSHVDRVTVGGTAVFVPEEEA